MRENYKTHVSEQKKQNVNELTGLIKEYPIVGIVNMKDLPAQQLNSMRNKLRDNEVVIRMAKKPVIKFALENTKADKQDIDKLEGYLKGMPAMLFTKSNPFVLFKLIKKNKSKAPAKAGQEAPEDIFAKAGSTSFAPGPIISELAQFGIKSKVDQGKVAIQEDTKIATEGDIIDDKLASMLQKLDIMPMEIGLDLVAIYEEGTIFTKKVLDVDEDQIRADFDNAARWAFNLAFEAGYPTQDNIVLFITEAFTETKALALEIGHVSDDTINNILIKANNQALSVKIALGV